MQELQERQSDIMGALESTPTQTYITLAFGSIAISALLYLFGRRQDALFVGQWAPTFGVLALIYKLIHPSREHIGEQVREATERVRSSMSK